MSILGLCVHSLRTGRKLKRLEEATKRLISAHTDQTIDGLITIRAYEKKNMMREENDDYLNKNFMAGFLFGVYNRWLSIRVDFISWVYILIVIFVSIGFKGSN